jgi:hypothetical protein
MEANGETKMSASNRIETDHTWFWEGKGDRHWYKYRFTLTYRFHRAGEPEHFLKPQEVGAVLGTVTRVRDTRSPYFNRWFAVLHKGKELKSDPLMSLRDAKAWLEVIERMNR